MALDEDALHLAAVAEDRLEDEFEEQGLESLTGLVVEFYLFARPKIRLAGRIDPVQRIDETLRDHLRQGFADGLSNQVAATDKVAIGGIRHDEPMLAGAEDRHEAGRLFQQSPQLVQFLVRIGVALFRRLSALQHPHRLAHTPQFFDFGNVDRVLKDQFDLALPIGKGGVRGAPVMGVETAVLVGNVVANMGYFVRFAGLEHPIERRAQLAIAFTLARIGLEYIAPDDIVEMAHGDLEIFPVRPDDRQVAIQRHIWIGGSVQQALEIESHVASVLAGLADRRGRAGKSRPVPYCLKRRGGNRFQLGY